MTFYYLPDGKQKYTDNADFYARFIMQKQLLDEALWQKFVEVFTTKEDVKDEGWRGEYFGKMMRGAVLTYRYLPSDELYSLLESTVRALLSAADQEGRISSYPTSHEFCGWDMWCRKYVLVGCLYFYGICKDDSFKAEILRAMRAHLDYILRHIGEGKTPVTETSGWYGGINSASILEPVVELYKLTKEPAYLRFAEEIIKTGGCKLGSVIEAANKGLLPHEFPTTKAYETMSFFEGVLAYYEVTGEKQYLSVVEKFADLVNENEITLIGCAGCRNEHFDHAAQTQANDIEEKTIMQETCVTVTWMRLQERLLRLTGDMKYADRMEASALNALYGAVNAQGEEQFCKEEKAFLPGVPFDSYSPLVAARRGIGIGGFKRFASGGFYGCCACIGSAGTALYPLSSAMMTEQGGAILFYHAGEVTFPFSEGALRVKAEGSLASGKIVYHVLSAPDVEKALSFRLPSWSVRTEVLLNGQPAGQNGSLSTLSKVWKQGDAIAVIFSLEGKKHSLNGKVAFTYGPFVLARDEKKDADFGGKLRLEEPLLLIPVQTEETEEIRCLLHTAKGGVLLTDYASCGKSWKQKHSRIAVWQKCK